MRSPSGDGEGGDQPGCCCGAKWRHWQGWRPSLGPPIRLEPLPQASHQVDPTTFRCTTSYFWTAILLRRPWTDVRLKITPLVAAETTGKVYNLSSPRTFWPTTLPVAPLIWFSSANQTYTMKGVISDSRDPIGEGHVELVGDRVK